MVFPWQPQNLCICSGLAMSPSLVVFHRSALQVLLLHSLLSSLPPSPFPEVIKWATSSKHNAIAWQLPEFIFTNLVLEDTTERLTFASKIVQEEISIYSFLITHTKNFPLAICLQIRCFFIYQCVYFLLYIMSWIMKIQLRKDLKKTDDAVICMACWVAILKATKELSSLK